MHLATIAARLWPFPNGAGRILDTFAKGVDLGSGVRLAYTSGHLPMMVFADDLIGRHILMTGEFDHSIVQVLLNRAQPNDVLLDIGANIGYVSACFLSKVAGSQVIAIEPQPGVVGLLEKNLAQFGDRATVHAVALSDKPGTLRFHIDADNRGGSRIATDGEIAVKAMKASALLAKMDKLDLIKIDVEGHELPVFRSIAKQLQRLKPRAILFEDQTAAAAPDGAIGSILTGAGYTICGIDKRLFKTQLVPVRTKADCRFNDYLAVSKPTSQ